MLSHTHTSIQIRIRDGSQYVRKDAWAHFSNQRSILWVADTPLPASCIFSLAHWGKGKKRLEGPNSKRRNLGQTHGYSSLMKLGSTLSASHLLDLMIGHVIGIKRDELESQSCFSIRSQVGGQEAKEFRQIPATVLSLSLAAFFTSFPSSTHEFIQISFWILADRRVIVYKYPPTHTNFRRAKLNWLQCIQCWLLPNIILTISSDSICTNSKKHAGKLTPIIG